MMRKVSFQAVLAVTAGAMFAPLCAQDAEAPAAEAPAATATEDGLLPPPLWRDRSRRSSNVRALKASFRF